MSLALSTLLYEWRRYMAAVVALAVAGLLVLFVVGLFMGVGKSFSATVDRSPASIMVLPVNADGFGSSQPRRNIPILYQNPEVIEASALTQNFAFWSNFPKEGQPASKSGVLVMVVDPMKGAVTLPTDFTDDTVLTLQEPYSVVVDATSMQKLGVKIGDRATMNGRSVKVAGTIENYPSLFNSMVFMSRQTAKLLNLADDGDRVGSILVKIKDPAKSSEVVDQLNSMAQGRFKAWTREQLSVRQQSQMLKQGFVVLMLVAMLAIGSFIGLVITWQTLQGAILANIKEFASLRALGVSMGRLRLIIMELSFWVGIAGLIMTGVMTIVLTMLLSLIHLNMFYPIWAVIGIGIVLLVIAVISGALSLGVLKKSQPADLLR